MITASFTRRNLSGVLTPPPGLLFEVQRYSNHAMGGPETASIRVTGGKDALWSLTNWARCGVLLNNDAGERVWWGYISKITIVDGSVNVVVDVEQMTNACAVAYTLTAFGQGRTGARRTTEWTTNAVSISEFGRREILDSMGDTTDAAAVALRDRRLQMFAYPAALPTISPNTDSGQYVELECRGYWYTLGWRYATVPSTLAFQYDTIGAVDYYLGLDNVDDSLNIEAYAQSFDVGAANWNLQQVDIYIKKTGSPAGDITVSVCENPDDTEPGSSLGSTTIAATSIGTAFAWVTASLSSPVTLTAGTSYFLKIATDEMSDANYYTLRMDEGMAYADGVLLQQVWNASTWDAVSADLPFRLYTNELVENTQQIRALITNYGQFLGKVYIENAAGITSESYRNGDSDAQYEVEELLEAGTSAGLRLTAQVLNTRDVVIRSQVNSNTTTAWSVDRFGQFYYYEQKIDPTTAPCGMWCRLRDVIPANVNTTELSGLGTFWIERAEYDAVAGALNFEPLGIADLWEETNRG